MPSQIRSRTTESDGRERGAEKAKGKRRQISPEINLLQQSDRSTRAANAYILTLINCDPDACNTDCEMKEGRRGEKFEIIEGKT